MQLFDSFKFFLISEFRFFIIFFSKIDYLDKDQLDRRFFENFIHIIGKDIVKFHTIFWPAILSSLNLPLPKKILIHDHWIYKGKKMSKSFGNVINPFKIMRKYGENAIRYNKTII